MSAPIRRGKQLLLRRICDRKILSIARLQCSVSQMWNASVGYLSIISTYYGQVDFISV
jgi:hypothetical protein